MSSSRKIDGEEFSRQVSIITSQIEEVTEELQTTNIELSSLKTEVAIFIKNVIHLQELISEGRDGKGILTRVALLEKSASDLEEWKESQTTTTKDSPVVAAEKTGKWQLIVALTVGGLSLIGTILTLIFKLIAMSGKR